jgi:hypothetical protein
MKAADICEVRQVLINHSALRSKIPFGFAVQELRSSTRARVMPETAIATWAFRSGLQLAVKESRLMPMVLGRTAKTGTLSPKNAHRPARGSTVGLRWRVTVTATKLRHTSCDIERFYLPD